MHLDRNTNTMMEIQGKASLYVHGNTNTLGWKYKYNDVWKYREGHQWSTEGPPTEFSSIPGDVAAVDDRVVTLILSMMMSMMMIMMMMMLMMMSVTLQLLMTGLSL